MQEIELSIMLVERLQAERRQRSMQAERLRQATGRGRSRTQSGRSVAHEIRGTLGRALVRAGGRLGGELA